MLAPVVFFTVAALTSVVAVGSLVAPDPAGVAQVVTLAGERLPTGSLTHLQTRTCMIFATLAVVGGRLWGIAQGAMHGES
jgi:hypothetical protein